MLSVVLNGALALRVSIDLGSELRLADSDGMGLVSVAARRAPDSHDTGPALSLPLVDFSDWGRVGGGAPPPAAGSSRLSASSSCALLHWAFIASRSFFDDASASGIALADPLQSTAAAAAVGGAGGAGGLRQPADAVYDAAMAAFFEDPLPSLSAEPANVARSDSGNGVGGSSSGAAAAAGLNTCASCTFVNPPGRRTCEICESSLTQLSEATSADQAADNEASWLCVCCGYVMPGSHTSCKERATKRALGGLPLSRLTDTDITALGAASRDMLKSLSIPFRTSASSIATAKAIQDRLVPTAPGNDDDDILPPLQAVNNVAYRPGVGFRSTPTITHFDNANAGFLHGRRNAVAGVGQSHVDGHHFRSMAKAERQSMRESKLPPLYDKEADIDTDGMPSLVAPNDVAKVPSDAATTGPPAFGPSWTCGTCTLINEGTSTLCTVCDTPKPIGFGLGGTPVVAAQQQLSDREGLLHSLPPAPQPNQPPAASSSSSSAQSAARLFAVLERLLADATATVAAAASASGPSDAYVALDLPILPESLAGAWRSDLSAGGFLFIGVSAGGSTVGGSSSGMDAPAAPLRAATAADVELGYSLRGRFGHGLPLPVPGADAKASMWDAAAAAGSKVWGGKGGDSSVSASVPSQHGRGVFELFAHMTLPPKQQPADLRVGDVGCWRVRGVCAPQSFSVGEALLPVKGKGGVTLTSLHAPVRCAVGVVQCVTGALDLRGADLALLLHDAPGGVKADRVTAKRLDGKPAASAAHPPYAGLLNMAAGLSNVCYQNSLLQSLFMTEELRARLLALPLRPLLLPTPPSASALSAASSGSDEDSCTPQPVAGAPADAVALLGWDAFVPFPAAALQDRGFVFSHPIDDELGLRIEDMPTPPADVATVGVLSSRAQNPSSLATATAVTNRLQWLFARLAYSRRPMHASYALQAALPLQFARGLQHDVTEWQHWLSERVDLAAAPPPGGGACAAVGPFESTFGGTSATVRVCLGQRRQLLEGADAEAASTDPRGGTAAATGAAVSGLPATSSEGICGEATVTLEPFTSLTAQFPGGKRAPITNVIVFVVRQALGRPMSINLPDGYELVEGGDICPGRDCDVAVFLAVTRESPHRAYNAFGTFIGLMHKPPITALAFVTSPARYNPLNRAAVAQAVSTTGSINHRVDQYDENFPGHYQEAIAHTDLNFCGGGAGRLFLCAERFPGRPFVTDVRIDSGNDAIPQCYERVVGGVTGSTLPLFTCREKWVMQLEVHSQMYQSWTPPNVGLGYPSILFDVACKDVSSDAASVMAVAAETGVTPSISFVQPPKKAALLWSSSIPGSSVTRPAPITDFLFVPAPPPPSAVPPPPLPLSSRPLPGFADAQGAASAAAAAPAVTVPRAAAAGVGPQDSSSLRARALRDGFEVASAPSHGSSLLLGHQLLVRRGEGCPLTQIAAYADGTGPPPNEGWEVRTVRVPPPLSTLALPSRSPLQRMLTGFWGAPASTADVALQNVAVTGVAPATVIVVNGLFGSGNRDTSIVSGLAFKVAVSLGPAGHLVHIASFRMRMVRLPPPPP